MCYAIRFGVTTNEDIGWEFTPAIYRGGGLLCIRRKSSFNVTEITRNSRWISLRGSWANHDEECIIVNVYAPCGLEEKRHFWMELEALKRRFSVACWCILGDFNAVREAR